MKDIIKLLGHCDRCQPNEIENTQRLLVLFVRVAKKGLQNGCQIKIKLLMVASPRLTLLHKFLGQGYLPTAELLGGFQLQHK